MNKSQIKIIAMDFDNTLVDHKKDIETSINKKLIDFLVDFIKKGNYAGIVTGRSFHDLDLYLKIMKIDLGNPFPNYIIPRESYIYTFEKGEKISYKEHNHPIREKISNSMFNLGNYAGRWAKMLNEKGLTITSWDLYGHFSLEYFLKNKAEAQKGIKIIEDFLKENAMDQEYIVHRNGRVIGVLSSYSGKGQTLLEFAKKVNVLPSEVFAIGDSLNDINMCDGRFGFLGACVENSAPQLLDAVKKSSGLIGKGIASDSVLYLLNKLKDDGRINI